MRNPAQQVVRAGVVQTVDFEQRNHGSAVATEGLEVAVVRAEDLDSVAVRAANSTVLPSGKATLIPKTRWKKSTVCSYRSVDTPSHANPLILIAPACHPRIGS